MLHSTCQARILNSFMAVIFEKIAVETASAACLHKKPTLYHVCLCRGAQEEAEASSEEDNQEAADGENDNSEQVKTVEVEMTTESAVFMATHMLACALDAQCFAMPSLSPFNPYLSCCICTISSSYMFTASAMLLCSWTTATSRYLCGMLYCLLWGASFCCLAIVSLHWS